MGDGSQLVRDGGVLGHEVLREGRITLGRTVDHRGCTERLRCTRDHHHHPRRWHLISQREEARQRGEGDVGDPQGFEAYDRQVFYIRKFEFV